MKYPAKITPDEDGFIVEFPDLPGCLTQGDTLEEAQTNAAEALSGYLASVNDRGIKYNAPSNLTGDDIYFIPVDADVAKEIAAKIDVHQIHQRIERGVAMCTSFQEDINEQDIRAKQIAQFLFYKISYDQANKLNSAHLYNGQMSNLYLQKFLYFAQTFALKFFDKHLFIDDCEAWELGPVIANVYTAFDSYRELLISPDIFPQLNSFARFIIDSTLGILSGCSTTRLVDISHEPGAAWSRYYKEGVKHIIIPIEAVKKYVPDEFLRLVDRFTERHKDFDESLVYDKIKSLEFLNE